MAVLVLFAVLQFGLATGAHADCVEADRLFQAASRAADPEPDLTRAVEICPDHANALNNLALLREGQGQLDEAERLYRRSIAAGGGAAPYAGLGDVQAARGEYTPAAQSYRQFLTLLREEVERGDPSGLGAYADAYKAKLAALPPEARAEAPVVSAEAVTRGLTRRPHLTRGLKVQHHAEPHIDVPILFETNSDVLTPRARTQVLEMARALKMPGLDRVRILVEGHTDDVGEDGYNLVSRI
jgi:outer membrane protein OmpA-like peptidoglycan-associated protein